MQASESRATRTVRLLVRYRRVIYLGTLALIVGLGIHREGLGWWLVTVACAGMVCGGLGFLEGMAFVNWVHHRKQPWD